MITVYKYGVTNITGFDGEVEAELGRMANHWNALVKVEIERRNNFRLACMAELPEYADAHRQITDLKPALDDLFNRIRQHRVENRTKELSESLQAEKDGLLGERKRLSGILKAEQKKLSKETQETLNKLFWAQVGNAYSSSGCYWPNKDETNQAFGSARQKAMQDKGMLQFKEPSGNGRFTQRPKLKGGGGVSVAAFLNGETGAFRATGPQVGRLLPFAFGCSNMPVDGKRHIHELRGDIIIHKGRDLPEDALIKKLQLVRKKSATKLNYYDWTMCITLEIEGKEQHDKANIAGVNLNFRKVGGRLRVMTAVDAKGHAKHWFLPDKLVHKFTLAEKIQGQSDDAWNGFIDHLKSIAALQELFQPIYEGGKKTDEACVFAVLDTWQSLGSYEDEYMAAKELYKEFRKNFRSYTGCRRNAVAWRNKIYEGYAKEVAENYAHLAITETPLAKLCRAKDNDGLAIDTELADIPKAQRYIAGLYELKTWLIKQSAKSGGKHEMVKGKVTQTCSHCGAESPKKIIAIAWRCHDCGMAHDIDENAGKNCIKLATGDIEKAAKKPKFARIKEAIADRNQLAA